jgi:hypothetical protein
MYDDRGDRSYDGRADRPSVTRGRREDVSPAATTGNPNRPRDEKLTDLAVDAIVDTMMKLTGNDVEKTNAAMNLIGAGAELPSTVESALSTISERLDPNVFRDAMGEIARRYEHRTTFVNESLTHLYGANGGRLVYWTKQPLGSW